MDWNTATIAFNLFMSENLIDLALLVPNTSTADSKPLDLLTLASLPNGRKRTDWQFSGKYVNSTLPGKI